MSARPVFSVILLAVMSAPLVGQDKKAHDMDAGKTPALEQFKRLAGDWVGKGSKNGVEYNFQVQYKVTSGGSAVMETVFPGTEHEMVTVIHPDGPDLLLTHYCMLGNQPHMKASGQGVGNKVEFKFIRATNLKSENDMHMHDATFTFVDKDTLRTEWTLYNKGKDAGHEVFEMKRKK